LTVRRLRNPSTTSRPGALVVLVSILLSGSALGCGRSDTEKSGPNAPRIETTTSKVPHVHLPSDQVVVRVFTGGGYVPNESLLGSVASLTVYGDGTVIEPDLDGPQAPGQLIRFRTGRLSQAQLEQLVARFERSGLFNGSDVDFGDPRVTDMPSTSVTFRGPDAEPVQVSAYAFADEFNGRVDGAARHNRDVLARLLDWADHVTKTDAPYQPERVAVYGLEPQGEGDRPSAAPAWPGPDLDRLLATDRHRFSWKCGVVYGKAVVPLVAAAGRSRGTAWSWNGNVHRLVLRTLLPGESECER